jgi:hypothetical protein
MFAARTKRSAMAFLFVALMITVSVAWFATLGWGLIALLQVLLSYASSVDGAAISAPLVT